ncbi:MAG: nucleotidyl transferase AbiEii/AbiGii toxin family protein [Pyrinomonadaceae bacterium]
MAVDYETLISSPVAAYAEGLRFFTGTGMLNDALSRLARDLEKNGIDYAVIGAIALNQYGYRRFTEDIDLLLTREGLATFREKLVGLGYRPAFEGAKKKFRTTEENIPVEIITSGEFPGDGLPKPVVFPDPAEFAVVIDGVKTVSLEKLIELKLTSGMTAGDRLKDLADVQELIKLKGLEEGLAARLNPFVKEKYLELHRSVRSAAERYEE